MSAVTEAAPGLDVARQEVPLAPEQSEYLTNEASFGALVRLAFRVSLATPLILMSVCIGLTKLVSRVPLIGWLLAIYGFILTVVAVVGGLVAVPLVALVLLGAVLAGRRPKLHRDLASRNAVRQSGTFEVNDNGAAGGTLVSPYKKFRLSRKEIEGLRPALTTTEEGSTLTGAVVHAVHSGDLLAAYDESGRELIAVTA